MDHPGCDEDGGRGHPDAGAACAIHAVHVDLHRARHRRDRADPTDGARNSAGTGQIVIDPRVLLAIALMLSLTAYALLGGADYGGGLWDLLASGPTAERQRSTIARAIGPVWEANHVWLIVAVVIVFTGFPLAFAALTTYLHVPLVVVLIGI